MQFMEPRKAEHSLRYVLVNRLVDMLTKGKDPLFPEAQCHVFGSLRTKLLLPSSDVDMCVMGMESCPMKDALDRISARLELLGIPLEKPKVIDAKVMIVKFTDKISKIDCDISINSINGRHNTHMVKRLLDQYPQARPLILVIKTFLKQRLLNEVFSGGLSSYSISLMVIHLLQIFYDKENVKQTRQSPSLGKLLLDFFHLFGYHFNYDFCALSLRQGGSYIPKAAFVAACEAANPGFRRNPEGSTRLAIEDPQCQSSDVSGGTRHMGLIRTAFQQAYLALTSTIRPPIPREVHAEHKNIFMRPTLLNRILDVNRELLIRRDALEGAYEEYLSGSPIEGEDQEYLSDYCDEDCSEAVVEKNVVAQASGRPMPPLGSPNVSTPYHPPPPAQRPFTSAPQNHSRPVLQNNRGGYPGGSPGVFNGARGGAVLPIRYPSTVAVPSPATPPNVRRATFTQHFPAFPGGMAKRPRR
jgi:DNA polymerase sigma